MPQSSGPVLREAHPQAHAAQRCRANARVRLRLETRLYGMQEAWHRLRAFRSLEATAQRLPARDSFGVEDPHKVTTLQSTWQQRDALAHLLRREVGALVRRWAEGKAGRFTLEELKARLSERARELAAEARRGAGAKAPGSKQGGSSSARKLATAPTIPTVHWRSVFTPQEAEALLKAVLARTRGLSEALGEVAMEVALRRLRIKRHPGFIKRYHGAEELGIDAEGCLVGVEAKGRGRNTTGISRHMDEAMQLSRKANLKRAQSMLFKRPKIGRGSRRLGGAYTRDELELYQFLNDRAGMKRLLSTHFNASTGHTRIFERDVLGRIAHPETRPLDEFTLDGLTELRARLEKETTR